MPTTVYEICAMPERPREELLSRLIPGRFLSLFDIKPGTWENTAGERCVTFTCPKGMPFFQVELRRSPSDRDAVYFLDVSNSPYGQMEISFIIVNDPDAERFEIDVDERGKDTFFGTARRNLPEEVRAMNAGLAPAQVRKGLRSMRDIISCWEDFFAALGHRFFFLEALTYNSAVLYERHGFAYMKGKESMFSIDRGFRIDGDLTARLDGSTPFRQEGGERSVRGRSWAIHDGILGDPWESPKMYKTIGVHAGVCTFTGERY